MIARYSRPELAALWTDEARMEAWRRVEVAACEELVLLLGDAGPSSDELDAIRAASFTVDAVSERERVTDHDVAAFVDVLAQSAGPAGRWIHFGLTSSDVLDTALALQLRSAGEAITRGAHELVQTLAARAREHAGTLSVGRTHGVHAEPTTFGVKLAGFAFEAHRNALRLERAFDQVAVGALSGAVGTYSATSPQFEERVLARLGLRREDVSTQVVPRDRHAELLQATALAGAGLERLATEVRYLQRTEVREVQEPFRAGRVLRANSQAGLENVALWHERDISHSSVERVILPDSTILLDYLQHRAIALVSDMSVEVERMRGNLELTHGALFSQRVLLALIESGISRDDAYRIVQELAQRAWDEGTPLRELLAADERAGALDLQEIFDYSHFARHAGEIIARRAGSIAPREDSRRPAPDREREGP